MDASPALSFLIEGLSAEEAAPVERAHNQLVEGKDNSYPSAITVLLTACLRQAAKIPLDLRETVEDQKKLLGEVTSATAEMTAAATALTAGTDKAEGIVLQMKASEGALKGLIKTAVSDIDVSELTKKFDAALLNSVTQSKEATAALVATGESATTQIARAQKATLIWSIPIVFLSAAILAGSIFVWQWTELKERSNRALLREIQDYGDAYTVLANAGMTLKTFQTTDGSTYVFVPQAKDAYKAADYHGCVIQIK